MANLQAITKAEFTKKSWKHGSNYFFSDTDAVCPLGAAELPLAMMSMPLAFASLNSEYSIVAVQALQQGANFYVNADGKWIGNYIPAPYRGHPFALAKNSLKQEELVLCIDTDSGLLIDDDTEEPFFDEDLELSEPVGKIFEFLASVGEAQKASIRICKSLSEHGLLKPWRLEFKIENGTKQVGGLFCIDEAAFSQLSNDAYAELRVAGAIPVIYCQLLSMQHMSNLTLFAQEKSEAESLPQADELSFDGTSEDGNISFDNF